MLYNKSLPPSEGQVQSLLLQQLLCRGAERCLQLSNGLTGVVAMATGGGASTAALGAAQEGRGQRVCVLAVLDSQQQ